jgi:hypothetical protein
MTDINEDSELGHLTLMSRWITIKTKYATIRTTRTMEDEEDKW